MKWDKNQISKKIWPLIFTEILQVPKASKIEKQGRNSPASKMKGLLYLGDINSRILLSSWVILSQDL
jgi:hypothetical protein